MDLRFYFSLFLRRAHYFLLMVAAGTAVGITLAAVLPPTYDAEAQLLWESASIDEAGSISAAATEQLQIIEQRVLTRANILEMVRRLDVYGQRSGETERSLSPDEIVEDMRSRIRVVVTGGEVRRGPAQATTARVSFAASTGALAANVTNEVVDLMLRENERMRIAAAGSNVGFYEDRVRDLGRTLDQMSDDILAFEQANAGRLPGDESFLRSQQLDVQTRLGQLRVEEARLIDQRDAMQRIFDESGGEADFATEPQTPEQATLADLRDQRTIALLTLSETHPTVRQLNGRIEALEQVVATQLAGAGSAVTDGRQLSAFELQMAEIDGQLQFIISQRELFETELESLGERLGAVPVNRNILASMQRDMENTRLQYNDAVANLAEAETIQVIERTGAGEKLTLIENAQIPSAPTSPNRPVIAAAGMGAGVFLGLGLIALMELMNSAVRRPVELTNKLGLTPLGVIPHIRTRWEIVRRRMVILGVFAMVLVLLPATLWFIDSNVTPLDVALNRVLNRLGLPLI